MNSEKAEKYFALYCDLIGFSASMKEGGSPLLFDYYGATWAAAGLYPEIRTYLFSDSIVAFVKEKDVHHIPGFIIFVVSQWSADGLLYQCFLGHGTFFEGRTNYGRPIPNFFGTEIDGTALVDAVNLQKSKPLGARIIISESAEKNINQNSWSYVMKDKKGNLELFLRDDVIYENDAELRRYLDPPMNRYKWNCHYYFSSIPKYRLDSKRAFKHYIWSIASCLCKIGQPGYFDELIQERGSKYPGSDINLIKSSVDKVLRGYKPAQR